MKKRVSSKLRSKIQRFFKPDHRLPVVMIRRIPSHSPEKAADDFSDQSEGNVSFEWARAINRRTERQNRRA